MDPATASHIHSIVAREILDSRGNPTVETTVILQSGYRGTVSVPSGASRGKYEAVELRDGDETRFNGLGVIKAVQNVNTTIAQKLVGMDALRQSDIDKAMIELDGTPNKGKLGANAILSVSLAVATAASAYARMAPYQYLNKMISTVFPIQMTKIPTPLFNMINGGKHGAGNLNIQEFHVIPATNKSFSDALETGVELYMFIKQILQYRNAVHSIGDEGGFAPNLFTNEDALEIIAEAVKTSNHQMGVDVFLGLDVAATQFKTAKGYVIKDRPAPYSTKEFINYFAEIHKKYQLLLLEDAIEEDDWEGWKDLTKTLGNEILIVGDDLIATNYQRLEKAITEKACQAIIIKPNQIGTLTELFTTVLLAKKNNIKCIVSHRSGETNDTFIADFSVAIQAEYVKFGAPARGERVAKYNRLLEIEHALVKK
jgi:enolase